VLFGRRVAVSADGNTALIGASGLAPADVWVFVRSGGMWVEQARLKGVGAVGETDWGSSLALSADGNTALVGGGDDNGGVGAVWAFTRSGATWTQQGEKLTGGGEIGKARFGESVALSSDGNTALVGGPGDNGSVGAAWVFNRVGGAWSQQGEKAVGAGANGQAQQGFRVALSGDGNTALVGGPEDNGNAGAVWTFTRSGSTWSQRGEKLVATEAAKGFFGLGWAVALSADGSSALIGDGAVNAAFVFARSGSTWSQTARLAGEGGFGSVALSADGNTALIGSSQENGQTGASWLYRRFGSVWQQPGEKLVGSGGVGKSEQGASVALSSDGNTALVGALFDDENSGAVWVFVNMPTLSVSLAGSGAGEVSGPGISCPFGVEIVAGPPVPGTCSANYAPGTALTLTATPAAGSFFAGWSGSCSGTGACTEVMDANQSVTATFTAYPPIPVCKGGKCPVVLLRPLLTELRETYSVFAVARSSMPLSGRTAASRHHRGTTFSFRLNARAGVKLVIATRARGRRVGRTCRAASVLLRHNPSCTRTVRVAILTRAAHRGLNEIFFGGRIAGRVLRPGHYTSTFTAINRAGATRPQSLSFKIVTR
jgi:hypothetical protein